jgi:hypothetical protein
MHPGKFIVITALIKIQGSRAQTHGCHANREGEKVKGQFQMSNECPMSKLEACSDHQLPFELWISLGILAFCFGITPIWGMTGLSSDKPSA